MWPWEVTSLSLEVLGCLFVTKQGKGSMSVLNHTGYPRKPFSHGLHLAYLAWRALLHYTEGFCRELHTQRFTLLQIREALSAEVGFPVLQPLAFEEKPHARMFPEMWVLSALWTKKVFFNNHCKKKKKKGGGILYTCKVLAFYKKRCLF